jgi:hypothetical protein
MGPMKTEDIPGTLVGMQTDQIGDAILIMVETGLEVYHRLLPQLVEALIMDYPRIMI